MMRDCSDEQKPIFLSYSRSDRDKCIALRSALEQAGLSVFRDEDSIRLGDRWLTRLEEALQGCCAFVLLVGRDGVRRWVGAEWQVALIRHLSPQDDTQRLPIFPILLEGAKPEDLPPFLALFQSARWTPAESLPYALLEAITTHVTQFDYRESIKGCPFLGLNAFGKSDAKLFFGRRKETLEALACLGDQRESNPERLHGSGGTAYHRWLQIEGNSGAGKSSLVNAGMLPMIEQGALWARTGFERWQILGPMMPGMDPLTKLAEVLEQGLIADPVKRDSLGRMQKLQQDERALAFTLRDFRQEQSAFLLIVDQFEELFTFAEDAPRQRFDALLANALQDPECPLFLISTVRADFLDRCEQLPRLQTLYNSHCKRYFLPTISEHGLREVIEQPAHLAGLDVSEVTAAILADARNEIGALPLVENALDTLWQHREGNRLSGERYRQENGIAGMLSAQADTLLERIDRTVSKGRRAALELLLRLTRINDEGRHTRQRITREEAVLVAGDSNDALGERVVRMLSGERDLDVPVLTHIGALRLITTSTEQNRQYIDLIHETLIRARGKDEKTGKRIGYWPTLYDYIEANRDRDIHRQQLKFQTEHWLQSKGLGRWWNLAGWRDLSLYRPLRTPKTSDQGRFLFWSRWAVGAQLVLLAAIFGVFGESAWWVNQNNLPVGYIFIKPFWVLGYAHLPEMVDISGEKFTMGCLEGRDNVKGECLESEKPAYEVTISQPFKIGKYEITFLQYDYYVWDQRHKGGTTVFYPSDSGWGRFDRPVINVSWDDAKAYARWLKNKTNRDCRLPSEAEWEYAARAGKDTAYWWGGEAGKNNANCAGCGSRWDDEMTAPVGSFSANPWGLYDTSGNVWEWLEDTWHRNYSGAPTDGSAWEAEGSTRRVVRGGSWFDDPALTRSAFRYGNSPDLRGYFIGFRVVCSSPIE
jgi:formylglycine-generating enzyme required for sulfatase activity